jgi:hypothetical protein
LKHYKVHFNITTSDIIGLFSGVATSGAAIATFLTVREIKKQRESSYLPDLCIDPFTLKVYGQISTKDILSFEFSEVDTKNGTVNDENKRRNIAFKIKNIGLGVAKKINFAWEFDCDKFVEIIKKIDGYDSTLPNSFAIRCGKALLTVDEDMSSMSPLHAASMKIPFIIWAHYLFYFCLQYETKNNYFPDYSAGVLSKLPKPKLTITFADIQNKIHKKEIFFLFNIMGDKATNGDKSDAILIEVKANEKV